ncbi:hypothetical protein [Sporolactobacillus terrae]|uniref:hypothetical protein n=1 Tax=Sporolactobacillus terrae TaxID=269673 RepID=UPI000B034E06|nr:hypothetical protein [Sporolactobacillus terrae]
MALKTNKDWYGYFATLEVDMIVQDKPHAVAYAKKNKCRYYRMAKQERQVKGIG